MRRAEDVALMRTFAGSANGRVITAHVCPTRNPCTGTNAASDCKLVRASAAGLTTSRTVQQYYSNQTLFDLDCSLMCTGICLSWYTTGAYARMHVCAWQARQAAWRAAERGGGKMPDHRFRRRRCICECCAACLQHAVAISLQVHVLVCHNISVQPHTPAILVQACNLSKTASSSCPLARFTHIQT